MLDAILSLTQPPFLPVGEVEKIKLHFLDSLAARVLNVNLFRLINAPKRDLKGGNKVETLFLWFLAIASSM